MTDGEYTKNCDGDQPDSHKWGMVDSFNIDRGELDGMDTQVIFTLGVEWQMVREMLSSPDSFKQVVHAANVPRLVSLARKYGREIVPEVSSDNDVWAIVSAVDTGRQPEGDIASAYHERSAVITGLARAAQARGWGAGWGIDDQEGPDWPIVFIDLPTGQVSWHVHKDDLVNLFSWLPQYGGEWDGHSTVEKYNRLFKCNWT